jgi:hypothetical protein
MTAPTITYDAGTSAVTIGPKLDLSTSTPSVSSGTYTPSWTTAVGFTAGPATATGKWTRIGDTVTVAYVFTDVSTGAGFNVANIGLPIPRTVLTDDWQVIGTGIFQNTAQGFTLHGGTGNLGTAQLVALNITASAFTLVMGMFTYNLK